MHHFCEVIISRVCTWHRSDGGGTDLSVLAGFRGRVVEIWRCRWLYTKTYLKESCCMRAQYLCRNDNMNARMNVRLNACMNLNEPMNERVDE